MDKALRNNSVSISAPISISAPPQPITTPKLSNRTVAAQHHQQQQQASHKISDLDSQTQADLHLTSNTSYRSHHLDSDTDSDASGSSQSQSQSLHPHNYGGIGGSLSRPHFQPTHNNLNLNATQNITMAKSMPAPRAPFLRSRQDQMARLRNMPSFALPDSAPPSSSPPMSSSLLSGHNFHNFRDHSHGSPSHNQRDRDGDRDRDRDSNPHLLGIKTPAEDKESSELFPHSLPTYMHNDRARVDWRWAEKTREMRNNSKEVVDKFAVNDEDGGGGGGGGDNCDDNNDADDFDTIRRAQSDENKFESPSQLPSSPTSPTTLPPTPTPTAATATTITTTTPTSQQIPLPPPAAESPGRKSVDNLSTSITAFDLLSSSRSNGMSMSLNLDEEDIESISQSVQSVSLAMQSAIEVTGVKTLGEEEFMNKQKELTERGPPASRVIEDDVRREDDREDDLGTFELDF